MNSFFSISSLSLFFLVSSSFFLVLAGTEIYVQNGFAGTPDGSQMNPFPTIKGGFDVAVDGDQLRIFSGTYPLTGNVGMVMGPLLDISFVLEDDGDLVIDLTGNDGTPFLTGDDDKIQLTVQGLQFKNNPSGRIIEVVSGQTVILDNCKFANNNWEATAIDSRCVEVHGASLQVQNSTFEDNYSPTFAAAIFGDHTPGWIEDSVFQNNTVLFEGEDGESLGGNGGALTFHFDSSENVPAISRCEFTENTADTGGAISMLVDNTQPTPLSWTLSLSSFTGNAARKNGGAIYTSANLQMDGCTLQQNIAQNGGAIAIFNDATTAGSMLFETSVFENNNGMDGGAVYVDSSSELTLSLCNFSNHVLGDSTRGGVIFLHNGNLNLFGARILGNSANNGGAVYVASDESVSLNVSQNYFFNNTASDNGGGINVAGPLFQFEISQTTFEFNEAANYGGGVYCKGTIAIYSNCVFLFNFASIGAGLSLSDAGSIVISESQFATNTANYGAGLSIEGETGGVLSSLTIGNNEATKYGGGIWTSQLNRDLDFVSDCVFLKNVGNEGGNHIFLSQSKNGVVKFQNCDIRSTGPDEEYIDFYSENATVIMNSTCSLPSIVLNLNSSLAFCNCQGSGEIQGLELDTGGVFVDSNLSITTFLDFKGGSFNYLPSDSCTAGLFSVDSQGEANSTIILVNATFLSEEEDLHSYGLNWSVSGNLEISNSSLFYVHGNGNLQNNGNLSLVDSSEIQFDTGSLVNGANFRMEGKTSIVGQFSQSVNGSLTLSDVFSDLAVIDGDCQLDGQLEVVNNGTVFNHSQKMEVLSWKGYNGLFAVFSMDTFSANTTAKLNYEKKGLYVEVSGGESDNNGLGAGAIAGIVIGVLVVVAILAGLVLSLSRRRGYVAIQEDQVPI